MQIRNEYIKNGVDMFYQQHSNDYRNPHEPIIKNLLAYAENEWDLGYDVIDLCCGSGEVTLNLHNNYNIIGIDAYTMEAYQSRTNRKVLPLTFKDIVQGKLKGSYDTIICSFALHLCEESMLPQLLWQLRQVARNLIVLSPHKRPNCDNLSNWTLVDTYKLNKVTMKLYI